MPPKPLRPCPIPGCPHFAGPRGRCPSHSAAYERQRSAERRAYDAKRGSPAARGYLDRAYLDARDAALAAGGRCQVCGSTASLRTHHQVPGDHGSLVVLCESCHRQEHARLAQGQGR